MKKITSFLKNNLIGIVLGTIIFGSAGAAIAATIQSSNVSYTTNKNSSITNVKQAIDDLYTNANSINNLVGKDYFPSVTNNVSFKYWNANFDGKLYPSSSSSYPVMYNSLNELIQNYGKSNFNTNPYYVKNTNGSMGRQVPCVYYNNKEFCVSPAYFSASTSGLVSGGNFDALLEDLKVSIEDQLGITPTCTAPEQYPIGSHIIKCTFGGKTCGYRVGLGCVSYQGVTGCAVGIEAFCGKCLYNSCGSSNIG